MLGNDCELFSKRLNEKVLLKAGTTVQFASCPMKADPGVVKDPTVFQADRFTKENKKSRRGTPEAILDHPIADLFSYGPRMCLG